MKPLTEKQAQVLRFIESSLQTQRTPSQRETAEHFGLSRNAVRQLIGYLKRKGYLQDTGGHRGLRLSAAYLEYRRVQIGVPALDRVSEPSGSFPDQRRPVFLSPVSAGFPSPAADYEHERLDLNHYLVSNPSATFFVRAAGDSMINAGIYADDLLIVDRSLEPRDGSVVIAVLDGEITVKRIRFNRRRIRLEAENDLYPGLDIGQEADFQVWGVVTHAIHAL